MLAKNDEKKMKDLMEENEDFRYIIEKLKEDQQYTVSMISHEIRNPVALINSSLQLIEKQHPEVGKFLFWEQTMSDIRYLRQLLNELSAFNNGERLKLCELELRTWAASLAASAGAYLASDKKIALTCEIQEELPKILADDTKLYQAVNNLLRNASEALDEGGRIIFRVFTQDQQVVLQVEDNGCGIPEEYLDTLFQPFVTHKSCGSGLGLPISKRIVEAHRGTLKVQSTPETGTCFTILLPF